MNAKKGISAYQVARDLEMRRITAKEGSAFHTDCNSAYILFQNIFKHAKVKHAVEFINKDRG